MTVPDHPPLVFASVSAGVAKIYFNDQAAALKEYPSLAARSIGATGTLFIEVDRVEEPCEPFGPRCRSSCHS